MILTSLLFTFACSSSGYLHSFNVNLVRKRSEMSLKRLFKVFKDIKVAPLVLYILGAKQCSYYRYRGYFCLMQFFPRMHSIVVVLLLFLITNSNSNCRWWWPIAEGQDIKLQFDGNCGIFPELWFPLIIIDPNCIYCLLQIFKRGGSC